MKFITESYYISDALGLERAMIDLPLDIKEIELLVGRFMAHSVRAGKLRGEVVKFSDGSHALRHCFTKKIVWEEG